MIDNNQSPRKLSAFPVFMRVEDRVVLIVGDGEEALNKARLLAQSSARLVIVANAPEPQLAAWVAENNIAVVATWDDALLDDAALVFAATGNIARDSAIVAAARRKVWIFTREFIEDIAQAGWGGAVVGYRKGQALGLTRGVVRILAQNHDAYVFGAK